LEGTSSPGFSNVLLDGAIEYGRLPIQRTFQENLEFIAAGDKSPNPSELLSSDRMAIFFSGVKDHYDYVLLDSPPAFLTSDPLILSHRVDGVIFIVRSGEVKKDVFRETLANFQKLETKMVGIIFNDARRENGKFSDKYSDYYEDGNGQKKRGIRFLKQKIFFR
jgi:Mrp family chromosome partitioning ATPase